MSCCPTLSDKRGKQTGTAGKILNAAYIREKDLISLFLFNDIISSNIYIRKMQTPYLYNMLYLDFLYIVVFACAKSVTVTHNYIMSLYLNFLILNDFTLIITGFFPIGTGSWIDVFF